MPPTEEALAIIDFLLGEAPFEGKWFSDELAPRFWWRKPLRNVREILTALRTPTDDEVENGPLADVMTLLQTLRPWIAAMVFRCGRDEAEDRLSAAIAAMRSPLATDEQIEREAREPVAAAIVEKYVGYPGKVVPTYIFDGGALGIYATGCGASNGNGYFVFRDDDLDFEQDDGPLYRILKLDNTDLTWLRDRLNEIFPPAPPRDLLETLWQYESDLLRPPVGDSVERRLERVRAIMAAFTKTPAGLTTGEPEHRLSSEQEVIAGAGHAPGSASSDGSGTNQQEQPK